MNETLHIFKSLFKGREDIYATRWEKGTKNGYSPAYTFDPYQYKMHRMKGGTFQNYANKQYQTLTNEQIIKHLQGEQLVGLYPLLKDNTSWFIAADFDKDNWAEECKAFRRSKETTQRIDVLEERYAIGEIDKELYLKFISKYRKEKLDISTEMDTLNFENSNLEKRVEKYCQILGNLPKLWASNGYKGKLELQELMFPKGIVYDREISNYRTTEINEVAFAMNEIARDIEGKDKGDLGNFYQKSPSVPGTGIEPVRV